MKTTRYLLKSVLVLAMIVMVIFALAACADPGDDHEHSYTPVVVDPTCT